MSEPIFECANIPVAVAAKALKVDAQTVRLLLQSEVVNWGCAYHSEYFEKIPIEEATKGVNAKA